MPVVKLVNIDSFLYRAHLHRRLADVWSDKGNNADKSLVLSCPTPANIGEWLSWCSVLADFEKALTPESADPVANYEFFEILGDASVNRHIIWYFQNRFPHLRCAAGVKYLARLKINTISRNQLARWTDELGLVPFIRRERGNRDPPQAPHAEREWAMLEDVFEALVGCMEFQGEEWGTKRTKALITSLLDRQNFDLSYEALWDAKTRLKELIDVHPHMQVKYTTTLCTSTTHHQHHRVQLWLIQDHLARQCIAEATASRKTDAEQTAASHALEWLRSNFGLQRHVK